MLMQPGQTIQPVQDTPTPQVAPVAPAPVSQQQPSQPAWNPSSEEKPSTPAQPLSDDDSEVSWSASEFIAHDKTASWYIILFFSAVIVTAGTFLLTRDYITSGMILVAALLFGIMGARKPRELDYRVSQDGIRMGNKFYSYGVFKSFSVMQEEGIESIWFMPLKRFMPGLSIYFAPNDGQKIVDVLSDYLPFEARELDPVDKLMHRLRF